MTAGDNPYFGQQSVKRLEARLGSPVSDPLLAVRLRGLLAHELMRLGRFEAAIERLEEARALLTEEGLGPGAAELHLTVLSTLAMAHLQLAEDQNCIARHTPASCILPIAPEAVHTLPQHARQAGDLYRMVLAADPGRIQERWLLNLARMISGDYPGDLPQGLRLPPESLAGAAPFPRWPQVAGALGVDASDLAGGAVMDDFDGDGLLDLVSSSWDPCEPMKAFRNDGRGGFEEVSTAWGLDGQLGGLNLVQADYDNDGMLDLLVLRGGWLGEDGRIRNSLLRNDLQGPAGRFVDVTAAAGLAYPAYPTQTAAWADYDGDGDLDLFVGNESPVSSTEPAALSGRTGRPYPSQLFRNGGDGTFSDVAPAAGVANLRFAKGVCWGDYDDDGRPDLYVSNIGPNRLYHNRGGGAFSDRAPALGVKAPAGGSFACWFFDVDNDGDLDLFVAAYDAPVAAVTASYLGLPATGGHPVLYRNDGGRFTDASASMGLSRPLLPMGANYGDLDNDGWLDFYLGTGVPDFAALMPNVMYRNQEGRSFADVTSGGGFGHLQKGHGVAFGDLDNDGDQDLFQQLGGAYPYDAYGNALYENPGPEGAWITLRLEGRSANRMGLGARIEVRAARDGEERSVFALAGSGGSYGGASLQQEIGLGASDAIRWVAVTWPGSGSRQVFRDVPPNRFYLAVEGEPELIPLDLPRIRLATGGDRPATGTPNHHDHD